MRPHPSQKPLVAEPGALAERGIRGQRVALLKTLATEDATRRRGVHLVGLIEFAEEVGDADQDEKISVDVIAAQGERGAHEQG